MADKKNIEVTSMDDVEERQAKEQSVDVDGREVDE